MVLRSSVDSPSRPSSARAVGDCSGAKRSRRRASWSIRKFTLPLQKLQTPSKSTMGSGTTASLDQVDDAGLGGVIGIVVDRDVAVAGQREIVHDKLRADLACSLVNVPLA